MKKNRNNNNNSHSHLITYLGSMCPHANMALSKMAWMHAATASSAQKRIGTRKVQIICWYGSTGNRLQEQYDDTATEEKQKLCRSRQQIASRSVQTKMGKEKTKIKPDTNHVAANEPPENENTPIGKNKNEWTNMPCLSQHSASSSLNKKQLKLPNKQQQHER